jgi:hypothetical protein
MCRGPEPGLLAVKGESPDASLAAAFHPHCERADAVAGVDGERHSGLFAVITTRHRAASDGGSWRDIRTEVGRRGCGATVPAEAGGRRLHNWYRQGKATDRRGETSASLFWLLTQHSLSPSYRRNN